ncbi:FAD-binding oxidoreductase [Kribbella italica]|uniref:FAD/FMN-containing dehydrogenase n=1 Tax=Kribbella italica TaxID=1540520 RepID=A0A7W9J2D1_9ACTN|nr:FAD-binding oxidoreductase [Kribbella italica]MBB5833845.1 FAD/FMN-containing dehydrogenase [Kribbella italica]
MITLEPRLVVVCRSVSDVVAGLRQGAATGDRVVPRGGGHCFARRSSTDGIVLDLSGLDEISVRDGIATVGAGVRLGALYAELHRHRRAVPGGCGPGVGIAGLTLGGGIGLLGRKYGLTCDRLVGVQVVLADGRVVECSESSEPELFWALRGAGGGQFGVVTSLRFATVPEPVMTRIEARWPGVDLASLVSRWQEWAPDAPDEVTVNLSLGAGGARLFGASMLSAAATRDLLQVFPGPVDVQGGLPYAELKSSFADPLERPELRLRSEFFTSSLRAGTVAALVGELAGTRREISLTAMGGAYNRVAAEATAFAHRRTRFLLELVANAGDPWVDASWANAHVDGSGGVYPNFPDPALEDWASAYHGSNYPRLQAVKRAYDPQRFFAFPQGI